MYHPTLFQKSAVIVHLNLFVWHRDQTYQKALSCYLTVHSMSTGSKQNLEGHQDSKMSQAENEVEDCFATGELQTTSISR